MPTATRRVCPRRACHRPRNRCQLLLCLTRDNRRGRTRIMPTWRTCLPIAMTALIRLAILDSCGTLLRGELALSSADKLCIAGTAPRPDGLSVKQRVSRATIPSHSINSSSNSNKSAANSHSFLSKMPTRPLPFVYVERTPVQICFLTSLPT